MILKAIAITLLLAFFVSVLLVLVLAGGARRERSPFMPDDKCPTCGGDCGQC